MEGEPVESPSSSKPSWQRDDCPAWCVSEHREDDLPDDRFHDSAATRVPAVVPDVNKPLNPAHPVELHVVTSRRCETDEDWVFIGQPDLVRRGFSLSRESAQRLAAAVAAHLVGL